MTITTSKINVPAERPAGSRAFTPDVDAVVDIVVPVHNEEVDLEPSVRRLGGYLDAHFPYPYCITIADNASTDQTFALARQLAEELPGVRLGPPGGEGPRPGPEGGLVDL